MGDKGRKAKGHVRSRSCIVPTRSSLSDFDVTDAAAMREETAEVGPRKHRLKLPLPAKNRLGHCQRAASIEVHADSPAAAPSASDESADELCLTCFHSLYSSLRQREPRPRRRRSTHSVVWSSSKPSITLWLTLHSLLVRLSDTRSDSSVLLPGGRLIYQRQLLAQSHRLCTGEKISKDHLK